MQVIGVYFVEQLEEQLVSNFQMSMNDRSRMLAYTIEKELNEQPDMELIDLKQDMNELLRDNISEDISEIQVIDIERRVVGTSDPTNIGIIGKKVNDPRVKRVLLFGQDQPENQQIEVDPKTGNRRSILIIPLKLEEEIIGAIYINASLEKVYSQMKEINGILAAGTGIALSITAILGIFLARTITRPMDDMRKQAIVMADGDFSRKVKVYGDDEIGQLAMAFNNLTKKLEEAYATTEGERRKLSSVLANMTDGVIATDPDGNIILMNDPAQQLLNVSRETVLGASILDVLQFERDVTLDELFQSIDSCLLNYSINEQQYILRASFTVIKKGDGPLTGLITVLQDVTEQEKIEQERREFVANVSHELRTPLTTMRSYLEALTDGAWQDEAIAPRFLEVTQNETERMIRLVNDLLQLSKLDSKDYKIEKSEIDFTEMFHLIIDRFEMSKGQGFKFVRHLPDESYYVNVDQDKITQVLDNIISNALKYSPEGGTVTFSMYQKQTDIYVQVKDEGVGIPKESLAKVFERFYRVDKARSRSLGGTGLGLAIAKEIVEVHGGQIWAESEEGKGTTITMKLPLKTECEVELT